MGDCEPDSTAEHDSQRLPRMRPEARPVPEVHERAEGEAENETGGGEGDPTLEEPRQERSREAAAAPAEHLPRSPRPLAEEEVRDKRGERARGEPGPRAEGRPCRNGDHGDGLHSR